MKVFEIRDINNIYGYLFSNDDYSDYYIEINDEVKQDIFFQMFLDNNECIINNDWTKKWIEERVIPNNRQNINDILKNSKIEKYNELELFIKVKGRSSMDNSYLKEIKIDDITSNIKERRKRRIREYIYDNNTLIVFFMDNKTILYKIDDQDLLKYMNNGSFLSIFGCEIVFTRKIRLSYDFLYKNGKVIDISYDTIIKYLAENLCTQREVILDLGYSRQYLHILSKNDILKPIKKDVYLKNDVILYKGLK